MSDKNIKSRWLQQMEVRVWQKHAAWQGISTTATVDNRKKKFNILKTGAEWPVVYSDSKSMCVIKKSSERFELHQDFDKEPFDPWYVYIEQSLKQLFAILLGVLLTLFILIQIWSFAPISSGSLWREM